MNPPEHLVDKPPHIFHFRATQLGKYFHGYCANVRSDEHSVILLGRTLVRYGFEPGEAEPRIEVKNAGALSLLKKDFHVIATAVVPPWWFQDDAFSA
jgi:hypothetical protein